jgi:hypothetical protein
MNSFFIQSSMQNTVLRDLVDSFTMSLKKTLQGA